MSYEPRKAVLSDIPSIIEAYFDAFGEHPINRRIFNPPSSESVQRFWTESLTRDLQNPNVQFYVITSPEEERVLAFAKWWQPPTTSTITSTATDTDTDTDTSTSLAPALPSWPDGADVSFAEEVFGLMDRKRKEVMGDRPHWYLEMLGVRKEFQRRGAGKALLRWGLKQADEAGIEAYLTASPAGTPLYQMHGFDIVETVLIDDGKRVENFMLRPPQGVESRP
ncbi:acyl-CoA N-acyltransferase [Hypoxylon rubiginosum]|uniref:Acyl-CoA N-acyltransferase n=1 Tax=Hypoxylon rubiginosum TaxID=110542 RepID=A0ACC0CNE3_9PEZI|nr:acyl-CoA N-acyltransferase [Hypoxylon rubiginosum]